MIILAGFYGDPIFFGSSPGFVNRTQSDPGFVNPVRSGPGFVNPIRSDPVQVLLTPQLSQFCHSAKVCTVNSLLFLAVQDAEQFSVRTLLYFF